VTRSRTVAILTPEGIIQFCQRGFTRSLATAQKILLASISCGYSPETRGSARSPLRGFPSASREIRRRCACEARRELAWFDNGGSANHSDLPELKALSSVSRCHRSPTHGGATRQVYLRNVDQPQPDGQPDELLRGITWPLKKVVTPKTRFVVSMSGDGHFTFPFFATRSTWRGTAKVGRSCTAFVFRTGSPMLNTEARVDRARRGREVELRGFAVAFLAGRSAQKKRRPPRLRPGCPALPAEMPTTFAIWSF